MGTPWRAQGVRTSIVHRYGTVERALSGPVVPKQCSDGNPSEPDMARRDPTSPDGSLNCPVSRGDLIAACQHKPAKKKH